MLIGAFVGVTAICFGLGGWACDIARDMGPPIEGPFPDAVESAELHRSSLDFNLFDDVSVHHLDRERQRTRLESWGWVDRERGLVHMPIDRAIELRLKREERR